MKKSKGITLIALIVTIIVLLILAGVAIATLTGENGLLTKASEAQKKTDKASDKERIQVEVLGSYEKDGKLDLTSLKNNITKNMSEATIEGESFPIKVKLGENVYLVTSDGKVGLYTSREGISVGDYINYTPGKAQAYPSEKLGEGYTGSTENKTGLDQETLKWRILNIDEFGNMDLISDPTSATVYFEGARGYNNGVYIMNDICEKLYSNKNKGITARSINLEDMEKCLTDAGKKAKTDYITNTVNNLNVNDNIQNVDKSNNTVTYKKGKSYYPVLWKVQSNESENYYTEGTLITKDGLKTSYDQEESNLTVKPTYYNISIDATNYGDGSKVLSNSNYYWVASRYVYADLDIARFGLRYADTYMLDCGMFYSHYGAHGNDFRLRAVVSLGSDIKVTAVDGASNSNTPHKINW